MTVPYCATNPAPVFAARYNPYCAQPAGNGRMDRLHCLCHHPFILAAHSFPRRALAHPRAIALSLVVTHVDGDVGDLRRGVFALASPPAPSDLVEFDSRRGCLCHWSLDLLAFRRRIQRPATGRPAGSSRWSPGTTAGNFRHPQPSSPSDLSGTSVRDAGVEPGHRAGGLLRVDGVRSSHGCAHDSPGGCGTGTTLWNRVPGLPSASARDPPDLRQGVYNPV
jgi:hypothetical protein